MRRLLWLGMLAGVGCSAPSYPSQKPLVRPMPWDGKTGPTQPGDWIGVRIEPQFSAPEQAAVDTLAAELSLLTWPELDVVPTQPPRADAGSANGGKVLVLIALDPVSPLTERWYALRIGSVPAGLEYDPQLSSRRAADGSYSSLFHVGSSPQLLEFQIYETKGGSIPVRLTFSEPVILPPGSGAVGLSLAQDGGTFSCHLGPSTAPPAGTTWVTINNDWLGTCTGGTSTQDLTLTVAAGFTISDGGSVAGLPYTTTLSPAAMSYCGTSCMRANLFALRGPQ